MASGTPAAKKEQDRLSFLPDALLAGILSLLSTVDAVRTSILSRRWRRLWMSTGALHFDDCKDFFSTGKRKRGTKVKGKRKSPFVEVVGKVLAFHHTPALQKFRLSCSSLGCPVEDWVRTAVSRGVRELDVRVSLRVMASLPSLLFISRSLVDLRLDLGGSQLRLPTSLGLVSLRSMHLHAVSFCNDHLTRELFASCTTLRSLALVNCKYQNLARLEISSLRLQKLTMDTDSPCQDDGLGSCQVKIAAPLLTSFRYRASVAQAYDLQRLLSLVYVKVQFHGFESEEHLSERVNGFLQRLSFARKLSICPACAKALLWRLTMTTLPSYFPFCNLYALTVVVHRLDYTVLSAILSFLVASPLLRTLVVQLRNLWVLPSSTGKEEYLKTLEAYAAQGRGALERAEIRCKDFLVPILGLGEIQYSDSTATVLELVKVLLGSQAHLQKLLLDKRLFKYTRSSARNESSSSNRRKGIMEKVLSFPTRSRKLAVAFL